MEIVLSIAWETWRLAVETAPWVLLGLLAAGLLKAFLPADFLARHLGRSGASSVLKATLVGLPLPLCSCGVLPVAAGLRRQGASKGATAAFLIATPETGVDSIALTWALLDPLMAVLRPLAAFVTACVTGVAVDRLGKGGTDAPAVPEGETGAPIHGHSCCSGGCGCVVGQAQPQTILMRLWQALGYAAGELLADLGGWLLLGLLIGGIIGALLPPDFFQAWAGDGFLPMLVMLVAGIPLYMCATSSTPVAAALALKGISPGAALVFLLAGPATNLGSLAVIGRLLGKRGVVVYVIGIALVTLGLGMAVNALYAGLGLSTTRWASGAVDDDGGLTGMLCALLLFGLIGLNGLRRMLARRRAGGAPSDYI